jgi:hypothetical protein
MENFLSSFFKRTLLPIKKVLFFLLDDQCFLNIFSSKSFQEFFDKDASIKYAQSLLEADYLSLIEIKSNKKTIKFESNYKFNGLNLIQTSETKHLIFSSQKILISTKMRFNRQQVAGCST